MTSEDISTPPDKVRVTVTDQAGGKTVTAELPCYPTMSRLLPALVTKMGLPGNVQYGVQHKQSGKQLGPNETLESAGVQSGDTLRLLPNVTAGGTISVRSVTDILITDAILSKIETDLSSAIGAIILYTDWDVSLAEFIRENLDELDKLAGKHCSFYLIEEPTERWIAKNKQVLKEQIAEHFDFLWKRIGWSASKPYDKTEALEIAQYFSVEPMRLPCIILFNSGNSNECLVMSLNPLLPEFSDDINEDYKRYFRTFFTLTMWASAAPPEARLIAFEKSASEVWKPRRESESNQVLKNILQYVSLEISVIELLKTIVTNFGIPAS